MIQTIQFPAPTTLINANHRLHWRAKAKLTKEWREATGEWVRLSRTLQPVDRAKITITLFWPDNRRRDVGNLQPTAKAIIDGLVDAGLLPDDDDTHLTGPDLRRGPKCDGRVVMVRVDVEEIP